MQLFQRQPGHWVEIILCCREAYSAFVISEVAAGCARFFISATAKAAVLAPASVFARNADATVASLRNPLSWRTMRRGARSMVASPSVMRIGAGQLQGPRCSELFNRGTSVQPAVQAV